MPLLRNAPHPYFISRLMASTSLDSRAASAALMRRFWRRRSAALQTPASRLALLLVQAGGVGVERGVVRVRVVVGSGRRVVVRRLRLRRGHRRGLRSERLQRHEQLGPRR